MAKSKITLIKTWNIVKLDVTGTDTVNCIHWSLDAVDGDYSARVYGTVSITEPTGTYIPYSEITKDIAVDWVKNALGQEQVDTYEISVVTAINNEANKVELGLPWV